MKGRARTQTNWQIQDEQDQTANSEQVSHCGLEKKKANSFWSVTGPLNWILSAVGGLRFINVQARLGMNWSHVDTVGAVTSAHHQTLPSKKLSRCYEKARGLEQSAHSLQHHRNAVYPLKSSFGCFHFSNSPVMKPRNFYYYIYMIYLISQKGEDDAA